MKVIVITALSILGISSLYSKVSQNSLGSSYLRILIRLIKIILAIAGFIVSNSIYKDILKMRKALLKEITFG